MRKLSSNFIIVLKTTPPNDVDLILNSGNNATDNSIPIVAMTSDLITSNYQMKIWGDVNNSNPNIRTEENTSNWISYQDIMEIELSYGDGSKRIYLKIRDDVGNEAEAVYRDILLNISAMSVVGINNFVVTERSGMFIITEKEGMFIVTEKNNMFVITNKE